MGAQALRVGGLTPFTAIDYPGKLSAVVFIQGCPWRCGYCHNPQLQSRFGGERCWDSIMALLARRVGMLDAVVFSGGEPTIDPALAEAMLEVRSLGMEVGLHTACIYPRRLEEVLPLADWVGFDIKARFDDYAKVTGIAGSGESARECMEMIVASGVPHECRTTMHPALTGADQLEELATTLAAAGVKNYALQEFRAQGCADRTLVASAISGFPGPDVRARIAAKFETFTYRST